MNAVFLIFLYGCSAWADSKIIRNSIDPIQRKMVSRLKKVHLPDILKNIKFDFIKPP